MTKYMGDDWLPPRYEGEPAPKSASGFEVGSHVTHIIWGRHAVVESIRELTRATKDGSRHMLRVRWKEGGVGTDESAHFVPMKQKPRAELAMETLCGDAE